MFENTYYTVTSERIPKAYHNYKIVHLSDLHGALHGIGNEQLIQAIYREKPDLILMTGDMMDGRGDSCATAIRLCQRLGKRYPVYYSIGNHEQTLRPEVWEDAKKQLTEAGIKILDNRHVRLECGGQYICLHGLTTPMVYYKDPLGEYEKGIRLTKAEVQQYLGKAERGCFHILLAHNPLYYPAYYNWGADLTLSGHIHGGIIRLPKLGGVFSPDLTLFPRYDGGYFERHGRHLIVSRGLGNNFLFRVLNTPELISITLRSSKTDN